MRRLYEAAKGKALEPASLVGDAKPLQGRAFEARTSLGAMAGGELRFFRGKKSNHVHGRATSVAEIVLGPGYFTVAKGDERAPAVLRFSELPAPDDVPAGWPAVTPNDRGLGSFLFDKVEIALRPVDADLLIGEVWSRGRSLGTHVALVRKASARSS